MRNGLLVTGWKSLHRPSARESPFMTHVNAPLTPTGRLRMVLRHLDDRIARVHVSTEFRVSRPTVAIWGAHYLESGDAGLADHPSTPRHSPPRTPAAVVDSIEALRRDRKWSARLIHRHLLGLGHELHPRAVGPCLARLGISRLRDLHSGRQRSETPAAAHPGCLAQAHGSPGCEEGRQDSRRWQMASPTAVAALPPSSPSADPGEGRLHLPALGRGRLLETGLHRSPRRREGGDHDRVPCRAPAFFAAHGIHRLHRVVTDNGAHYRTKDFSR